ncbi:uncharacterized protein LOC108864347 [Galendromus occidentalis]|uniref:Uncharacterized protein LOC108864347 n=1 Tax=Galendromus occidentalis TaxID=34638 RepID=A0AAJ7P9Y0_9ACAR|nr:uncharacterized protein LOC108864347 [Galendromus occidentalis]
MATGVPKLTYANAVLASRASRQITAIFDRTQVAAGKWAMGITAHKVATEFVLGELGWSTFESREAQSKIRYFARVSAMDSDRWPRKCLSMMASTNIYTEATARLNFLKKRFSCTDIPLEYTGDQSARFQLFNEQVKRRIKEKLSEQWTESMSSKSSLTLYRQWKVRGVTVRGLYTNSRGSTLLALARAGMLPTRAHRTKYEPLDPLCTKCGREVETIPHIIMKCEPYHSETNELPRMLGLEGEGDDGTCEETKRTLEEWEDEARRIR